MFLGVLFVIFLVLCLLVNLVKLNNPYFETSPSAIFINYATFILGIALLLNLLS